MQAGDIVFVRSKGVLPTLIRLWDKGYYSHVAVAVSDKHIVEAQYGRTINFVPLEYDNYTVVRPTLTPIQRDLVVHNAIDLVGVKYDYKEILGIMLKRRKKLNDPKALICSEVVNYLMYHVGYIQKLHNYTPNELFTYFKNREGAKCVIYQSVPKN